MIVLTGVCVGVCEREESANAGYGLLNVACTVAICVNNRKPKIIRIIRNLLLSFVSLFCAQYR